MILSKSCVYGIQAAIHVASVECDGYVPIHTIAERLNISFHFLTKVLQQFTQAGLLLSYRGPKGGVALAMPAAAITLYDMIAAIDGTEMFTECLLGLPGCGKAEPCPAHDHWVDVRLQLATISKSVTLEQLGKRANELNVRLSDWSDIARVANHHHVEMAK